MRARGADVAVAYRGHMPSDATGSLRALPARALAACSAAPGLLAG